MRVSEPEQGSRNTYPYIAHTKEEFHRKLLFAPLQIPKELFALLRQHNL